MYWLRGFFALLKSGHLALLTFGFGHIEALVRKRVVRHLNDQVHKYGAFSTKFR